MSQDLNEIREDADQFAERLPRSGGRDEALEIAIKAAEASMQALKLVSDPNEKARLSTRVKHLLQEAERIKYGQDWKSASALPGHGDDTEGNPSEINTRMLKEAKSSRQLSNREQILLLKAGYLNGFKFPPWTNPPAPGEFELGGSEALYKYVWNEGTYALSLAVMLTVSPIETSRNCPFPISRRRSSMTGSGLMRPYLHQRGSLTTASTSALPCSLLELSIWSRTPPPTAL